MKLRDLLCLMEGETYVQLTDVESGQYIEAEADNALLRYFGETEVKGIYAASSVEIKIHTEKGENK